ncbi:MAG: hypothetical protein J6U54_08810 [Clostridiales bacterium]|nr:hypothetical protein [Clostridiales bacterium]
MIANVSPYLDLLLKIINIIVLFYAFYKFTKRPGEDMAARFGKIEARLDDLERSLNTNWEQTRKQQSVMDDIQLCLLYLLDFEAAYCSSHSKDDGTKIDTTNLDKARDTIRQRLKQ